MCGSTVKMFSITLGFCCACAMVFSLHAISFHCLSSSDSPESYPTPPRTGIAYGNKYDDFYSSLSYLIRPFEETCVCCLTECGDSKNAGGAAFYNKNIYNNDIWYRIVSEFEKYGEISKKSGGPHISFEYFCCLDRDHGWSTTKFKNLIAKTI